MARTVELPKTTVLRILSSLEELGMVERIEGQYLLGPGINSLTSRTSPASALRSIARPYLTELSEFYGENVSVGIADGDELLYIDTALAPGAVQVSDWTGRRVPFHADAAGLCVLAGWDDAAIDDYASGDLARPTARTITDLGALEERLRSVRRDGHAWTFGEFSEDVNGVAAPIDIGSEIIGAVNVYGPAYRWPEARDRDEIAASVRDASARIANRFAGPT